MSQHPSPPSQLIPCNPSLSPALVTDTAWDLEQSPYTASPMDTADWSCYTVPLSPPTSLSSNISSSPEPPTKKIRFSPSPDPQFEGEQQQFIPTQKVFNLPEGQNLTSPLSRLTSTSKLLSKKFVASPSSSMKKDRGGEKISTKDFVPPDVSGLSKREARLVKNRAAAFLSRQRKREEFEAMEM